MPHPVLSQCALNTAPRRTTMRSCNCLSRSVLSELWFRTALSSSLKERQYSSLLESVAARFRFFAVFGKVLLIFVCFYLRPHPKAQEPPYARPNVAVFSVRRREYWRPIRAVNWLQVFQPKALVFGQRGVVDIFQAYLLPRKNLAPEGALRKRPVLIIHQLVGYRQDRRSQAVRGRQRRYTQDGLVFIFGDFLFHQCANEFRVQQVGRKPCPQKCQQPHHRRFKSQFEDVHEYRSVGIRSRASLSSIQPSRSVRLDPAGRHRDAPLPEPPGITPSSVLPPAIVASSL